ncbi:MULTISPECIES: hypothetical protein [Nostocales]|uniref:Beta/gamma crystallin 'Greek key' domain-containing protein n=3 Tax=Nostocales TaxID=1161 RepID=A0A8S9TCL8_9CYAN|nr:hypothetical protein [Tolypothrix bouteillei]KAF3889848.1 hypothetical protein DA73_0400033570 [Tolypothrix bouteillei VB521301]
MKVKKISHISAIGFSISVFAASTISIFANTSVVQAQQTTKLPQIATVTGITNGDISCYVDLIDSKRKKYQGLYASYDICAKEKTYLNKKVRLFYGPGKVNDCQSAEPCGKSRTVTSIKRMQLVR